MRRLTAIANIVQAGTGVFSLILLGYVIYHYGWTHTRDFASLAGRLLYYGLPALGAALCFAALRLKPSHRINAALLLVSIGASTYAVETLMTIWFSLPSVRAELAQRERVDTAKALGVPFDTRGLLEVVADLRKKGIEAYPFIDPRELFQRQADGTLRSTLIAGTDVVPLAWISNRVSVLCNEGGDYLIYESDEHGFHNPRGLWNNGRAEVVALGDSYVHGYCVPSDKNFVALIRTRYPATLSLGIAGHGPLYMLGTLREYGRDLKPKVVLWFHYEGNDLRDLWSEKDSPVLMRYLDDMFRQGLIEQQDDIDLALKKYLEGASQTSMASRLPGEILDLFASPSELLAKTRTIMSLSHLRGRLGLVYGRRGDQPTGEVRSGPRDVAEMELFARSLHRAKESVSAWGGTLYFVYLPHWHRYARPALADPRRERVLQTARATGLRVIDIHEAFAAQSDPLTLFALRLHSHYNERGHRLVADEVLRAVSSR